MSPKPDDRGASGAPSPFLPIAWGFYLLSLPLWIAIFLAESSAGAWANGLAAAVMTALGLLLHGKAK